MGVEVEGLESMVMRIQQVSDTCKRRVINSMRKDGVELRDLARRMAPIWRGNLEHAIKCDDAGGGRDEDTGQFTRKEVVVYIDMEETFTVFNKNGKTREASVGDYAYAIYYNLPPLGTWQLGKDSQLKQELNPDIQVGGEFLERAAIELNDQIVNDAVAVVSDYLWVDF
jgi:hypothetical protein